jgi:recombination protein RecA
MTTATTTKDKKAKAHVTNASAVATLARAMILKTTKQRPMTAQQTTLPHVPSGSVILDTSIGGSRTADGKGFVCPGYPRRRITEIYGPESSGKTTVALTAIANVQKNGGTAMFLDFEHALHHGYAKQIGVQFEDLLLYAPDTMEDGFKMILVGIMAGVDIIVVDSVASMVPALELEKKIEDTAKIGAVAKKMSETLPKLVLWLAKYPTKGAGESKISDPERLGTALILLNQERATISTGGGHGAPEANTAGGKALKYFAYVRLRLARILSERVERKDPATGKIKKYPFGNLTSVKVIKAKADAKQGHEATIFIRYGFGIDDLYSIIMAAEANGIIKREGSKYTCAGEAFMGKDKLRAHLIANPKLAAEIKGKVVEAISSAIPTAIPDEEISDEDAMQADLSGELGDDDDDASGGTQEITIDTDDPIVEDSAEDESDGE